MLYHPPQCNQDSQAKFMPHEFEDADANEVMGDTLYIETLGHAF